MVQGGDYGAGVAPEMGRLDPDHCMAIHVNGSIGAPFREPDEAEQKQMREVAGDDVPATSHPLPLINVTRPDEPRPSLTAAEALAGAPAAHDQRFRVPRILEED